jgi:hypothetical protein
MWGGILAAKTNRAGFAPALLVLSGREDLLALLGGLLRGLLGGLLGSLLLLGHGLAPLCYA